MATDQQNAQERPKKDAPRKPLPEALPSGLSRARPRSNARVGASETIPGGSPQWPVVRTPTLQRTRKRKNAVKRTVFCAPKRKNAAKRVVSGTSETTPGGFPKRPAVRTDAAQTASKGPNAVWNRVYMVVRTSAPGCRT